MVSTLVFGINFQRRITMTTNITPIEALEKIKEICKKYPKTTELSFDVRYDFKEQVLNGCIQLKQEIQDQVRALFND